MCHATEFINRIKEFHGSIQFGLGGLNHGIRPDHIRIGSTRWEVKWVLHHRTHRPSSRYLNRKQKRKRNKKVRFPVPNRLPRVLSLPSSENRIFTSKPFEHSGGERGEEGCSNLGQRDRPWPSTRSLWSGARASSTRCRWALILLLTRWSLWTLGRWFLSVVSFTANDILYPKIPSLFLVLLAG